jgi:GPH family glycoside/pentoside/hexuronide:cation symporter
MLTGTLDSLINSNYGALFPELFTTESIRAKTNALRQVFQLVAMIISIALTPLVTKAIGYSYTAMAYGALAIAVILYMTFTCHETPEAQNLPRPKLWPSIVAIARNPKFWLYGLTNAAFFAALAVLQQAASFYAKYVLSEESLGATIMLASVIVFAIAAIPLWGLVVQRLHLMKTWRITLAFVAVSLIPLYFTNTLIATTLALILLGLGYGGVCATMDMVGARILDEDKALYGVQREGTFSSLTGVLNKTSGLFAAAGFLLVSRIYGYQNGENPGLQPSDAARFLVCVFPFAIMIVCCVASLFLHFKENEAAEQTVM